MSDTYDIDGVTITPKGGGVFELTHPSLTDPIIERGKDKAEALAAELAKGFADKGGPDDGSMQQQTPNDLAHAQAMAALQAQLDDANARADAAEAQMRTVSSTLGDLPDGQVPGATPRRYEGTMNAENKKVMADLGISTTDIILEENPEIPPTGLYLGHNGVGYMISPGEPVTVPDFLLEILDHAIMSSPIVDTKTQRVLGFRDRRRYPYQRV